jgi:hypothetical protein
MPAAAFQGGQSRLKAGCGQDWPPHKSRHCILISVLNGEETPPIVATMG